MTAEQSPDSIHRCLRDVAHLLLKVDISVPVELARPIVSMNIEEVVQSTTTRNLEQASQSAWQLLGILAEEGELDEYFLGDKTKIREWVQTLSTQVKDAVLKFLLQGVTVKEEEKKEEEEDDEVAKVLADTNRVYNVLLATSVAMRELDTRIQRELGVLFTSSSGKSLYSIIGFVLNDIRQSLVECSHHSIALEWPAGEFPHREIVQHAESSMQSIGSLRRFRSKASPTPAIREFLSVVNEVVPMAFNTLLASNRALDGAIHADSGSSVLSNVGLTVTEAEATSEAEIFYPRGLVSLIAQYGEGLMHYVVDGTLKTQSIGIRNAGRTNLNSFQTLQPAENPGYNTIGYASMSLLEDGQLLPCNGNMFSPVSSSSTHAHNTEMYTRAAFKLNAQLRELAEKYPDVFALTDELSPMIFVNLPGNEVVTFAAETVEQLCDVAFLMNTDFQVDPQHLGSVMKEMGIELHRGYWVSLFQPQLAEEVKREREEERFVDGRSSQTDQVANDDPQSFNVGDAPLTVGDEHAMHRALLRSEIRDYTRPTLKDMLGILSRVSGVTNVEYDKSRGRGSHNGIFLTRSNANDSSYIPPSKMQKHNVKLRWSEVLSIMINERNLNIPEADFLAAIESGNELQKAPKKKKSEPV